MGFLCLFAQTHYLRAQQVSKPPALGLQALLLLLCAGREAEHSKGRLGGCSPLSQGIPKTFPRLSIFAQSFSSVQSRVWGQPGVWGASLCRQVLLGAGTAGAGSRGCADPPFPGGIRAG